MDHPPQLAKKHLRSARFGFCFGGLLAGLLAVSLIAGAILLMKTQLKKIAAQSTLNPIPDAFVFIEVGADGSGVERGEVNGSAPVTNLTWVIVDKDGYTVLERSADNESMYRYLNSRSYLAHINPWYERLYHQISDEVHIDC